MLFDMTSTPETDIMPWGNVTSPSALNSSPIRLPVSVAYFLMLSWERWLHLQEPNKRPLCPSVHICPKSPPLIPKVSLWNWQHNIKLSNSVCWQHSAWVTDCWGRKKTSLLLLSMAGQWRGKESTLTFVFLVKVLWKKLWKHPFVTGVWFYIFSFFIDIIQTSAAVTTCHKCFLLHPPNMICVTNQTV